MGGKPGYRRWLDFWIVIHLGIGSFLSIIIPGNLAQSASTVLIPLVGLFLAFPLHGDWKCTSVTAK